MSLNKPKKKSKKSFGDVCETFPGNSYLWSKKELDELMEKYPDGGYKACKIALEKGKTCIGIQSKASYLNLRVRDKDRGWSKKEIAEVKEKYPIGGYKACTLLLKNGRLPSQIKGYADKRGIKVLRGHARGVSIPLGLSSTKKVSYEKKYLRESKRFEKFGDGTVVGNCFRELLLNHLSKD